MHMVLAEPITQYRCGDTDFKYMSHEMQMHESPRVIEVGAMAFIQNTSCMNRCNGGNVSRGMLLRKLDEMEGHLKTELGEDGNGIKGCEMIREALMNKRVEDGWKEPASSGEGL